MVQTPLRILIVYNRVPYPLNDGGAIGSFNFLKGYAEAGCRITTLAMNTSKHFVKESVAQDVLIKYGELHLVPIDNRIKWLPALLNLLKGTSYVTERFISTHFEDSLIQLLQNNTYDVVHVDGLPSALYINTIRKFSNAKVVLRAHNVEHLIWQRIAQKESNILKRIYLTVQANRLKRFEQKAMQLCDAVLAISEEDKTAIHRFTEEVNAIIVPAGMDVAELPENTNYNPYDLFFIGSFDWMPNLQGMQWFIDNVLHTLSEHLPDVRIHIAGKKMPQSYTGLRTENFIPVGEVPDAKTFMLQHGLMLVPIVSGSGIRIKILEAMALGKTIVATTIAAEGLGLTDSENILIADNATAFSEKIRMCVSNPDFCRSIGANAHRFTYQHYRNQSIFQKLTAYYRNLI